MYRKIEDLEGTTEDGSVKTETKTPNKKSNDHDEKNAAAAKSNHLTMARKLHGSVYRERRRKEAVGSASTASLLRKPTSTMCEVSAKSGRSPVLLCTGR